MTVAEVETNDFPRPVRVIRDTWIPMPDGTRLAARIWLPTDAEQNPVPGILEFIPYRKGDNTAVRDARTAPWFAGHGYAVVRVDLRGTGNSEGVITDEYTAQELDDGVRCLDWIGDQAWCTGKVGMMGISWGGFNALQVAALAPSSLHAVLALCATDDRYADDVHYWGGTLLADQQIPWATQMLAYNALPPEPEVWGEEWLTRWVQRLDETPPFSRAWMEHQTRDKFWQHASVCEDPSAIRCPVFIVSGWADAYRDAVFRLLKSLAVPRRGLIGPWAHKWPQSGGPGPRIGFLQEALRWWDHWLKDMPNGAAEEPMLTAWVQDFVQPAGHHEQRPGRWIATRSWPSGDITHETLELASAGAAFGTGPSAASAVEIFPVQSHGVFGGRACSYTKPFDQPVDQRPEDAKATCFTSEPLTDELYLLGVPEAELTLACDSTQGMVVVRICDVAPDGTSLLISRGALNLTHRESHEEPEALTPGQRYTVRFPLNSLGHAVPPGHRIRIALSPTYWPLLWPSPEAPSLTLHMPGSRIHLPVLSPECAGEVTPTSFEPPEQARTFEHEVLTAPERGSVTRDLSTGHISTLYTEGGGYTRVEDGQRMRMYSTDCDEFEIAEGDPTSATVHAARTIELSRDNWDIRVVATGDMTSDKECFHTQASLVAYHGEQVVFDRKWTFDTPRNFT